MAPPEVTVIIEQQHEHTRVLREILGKVEAIMAAQDDIDASVATIGTAVSTLAADVTAIAAQLASGGGTPVNTAALVQAAADLVTQVNAVTALVPGAAPASRL